MPKNEVYEDLVQQLRALLAGECDLIANAANTSALIFQLLDKLNWVGFYLLRGEELVVGPFQGRPACTRIAVGRGVCGTAAQQRQSVVVEDVDKFPGHIACDAASRAEIVVPIIVDGRLVGVLDLDSPIRGRFDHEDQAGLEALVKEFTRATNFEAD